MEYELIIAGGIEPKETKSDVSKEGFMRTESNYELETYKLNQPLSHKAEYLAIMIDKAHIPIQQIFTIDQSKSDFKKGLIIPKGKPILIRLKVKDDEKLADQIWYTSFKTLLIHKSLDEFTEEKSKPFTRENAQDFKQDLKVLCNGSCCIHTAYCKFLNRSQNAILKTKDQSIKLG